MPQQHAAPQSQIRQAVRRLARTTRPPKTAARVAARTCTVDHIVASGSRDGVTAVFITLGADTVPAPYLKSYNAAAAVFGDVVWVEFSDGSPIIHGQVVGLPNV